MSRIDYSQKIPNNVNLAGARALRNTIIGRQL